MVLLSLRTRAWFKASAGFGLIALIAAVSGALTDPVSAGSLTIQGTVSYPDGTGAPNVQVELHTPDGLFSRQSTTNSAGQYSFTENLTAGYIYGVEIRPPTGYTRPPDLAGYNFTYTEGMATQTFNFTLVAAPKTVAGRVMDTNGNPINGAAITFFPAGSNRGASEGTHTGNDGMYSKELRGGDWYANATADLSDQKARWINAQLPVKISFKSDDSTEASTQNFVVTPATGNLRVTLFNADGSKLTTSNFVADIDFRRADGIGTMRKVDANSSLNIWLTPGIYTIAAYHNDLRGKSFDPAETTFVMTDGGTVDLGTVKAQANSAHLKGNVTTKTGVLANARVEAIREGGAERIEGNTGQDGGFDLTVGAGTWIVGLRFEAGSNNQYSQEAPATATVKNGETASGLSIKAALIDRTISGSVLNSSGDKVTDFVGSVYVRTVNNKARVSAPVVDGDFTLKYSSREITGSKVIIGAQAAPGSPYAGGSEATVSGSAVQNITLKSYDATLTGMLKTTGGVAVANPGSDIIVVATDDQGNFTSTTVGADGRYSLPLVAGTWLYDYEIENPENADGLLNRPAGQNSVTVKAGQTITRDLTVLKGTNTITGTVTDADGNTVKRVPVTVDNRPGLENNASTNPNSIVTMTVETNESGVYSAKVPNGTYLVTVGETPAVADTQLPPDGKTAKVSGSATATVNLTFEMSDATISGTVKFNGKTDAGGTATAFSDDGAQATATVGANGKFTLNVSSKEKWHVVVTDLKGKDLLSSEVADVTPKSGSNAINLVIKDTTVDVPGPVTKTFDADEGANVSLPNGMSVTVPPFGIDTSGTVSLTVTPTVDLDPTSFDRPASLAYEIKAEDSQGREVRRLNREMTVSMPYDQKTMERNGLNEKNLSTKFFNPQTTTWETSGVSGLIDKADNVATFTTTHLTKFSVTGASKKAPKITKAALKSASRSGAVVEVAGTNFAGKVSVKVGTVTAKKVVVSSDGTKLTITFTKQIKNGSHTLLLTNGNGRTVTIEKGVTVNGGKVTFKLK